MWVFNMKRCTITKKQYSDEKKALGSKLDILEKRNECTKSILENRYFIPQVELDILTENWERNENKIWETKQELKFLEDRFSRRYWTFQDHQLHELITSNVD